MNKTVVIISGRLPALNEYTSANRSGVHVGAKMKKSIETALAWELKAQLQDKKFERIALEFAWYEKDKRRDKDNICFAKKFVLDALQTIGAIKGDGWKHIESFRDKFFIDADCPHIEITIIEV